ncbi:glutamate receptor [Elysia marginata]|uniref:Glutamate receptor n=1 Tax=Elysia marginata TaxID=1093978 RepID=A0AAV4IGU0_9GAST|nr:glutamate receptor [Elysia marginata]
MTTNVIKNEVTLGVGPISITSERKSVIDFTTAFAEEGVGILTRRPGFGSMEMFRLFKPFEALVWICLACSVIVISVVLFVINKTSPFAVRGFSHSASSPNLSLFHCFWAILACSLYQGTDLHPVSHSARLVVGFWWVFIILVVSTYTASLAAVLTVTVFEKSINSLSELAEQSEITPLIKPGTNLDTLFQTATNDVYKSIASRLAVYPESATNEEAMAWVKEKNMAFMTDR